MNLLLTFNESVEDGLIVSFQTSPKMNQRLTGIAQKECVSKSCVIRKLISYGFAVLDKQDKRNFSPVKDGTVHTSTK
jgi:predicted transcriptional regulator